MLKHFGADNPDAARFLAWLQPTLLDTQLLWKERVFIVLPRKKATFFLQPDLVVKGLGTVKDRGFLESLIPLLPLSSCNVSNHHNN